MSKLRQHWGLLWQFWGQVSKGSSQMSVWRQMKHGLTWYGTFKVFVVTISATKYMVYKLEYTKRRLALHSPSYWKNHAGKANPWALITHLPPVTPELCPLGQQSIWMWIRHLTVSFKPTTWLKIKVSVNDKMSILRFLNPWIEKASIQKHIYVNHEKAVLEFLDFICSMSSQSSVYLNQEFIRRPPKDNSTRIYANHGLFFVTIPSYSIIRPTGYDQSCRTPHLSI